MFDPFGRFHGGYVGYGQGNTDVPLENAQVMLAAFSRLRYAPSPVMQ